ncbi:MAG: hypothetical protein L3J28_07710 [Candidatus Polarisedimenticolaceae bacterium]|nr:hypothetical protein [Candidatus Polarisedimenticolaceae bacterium]
MGGLTLTGKNFPSVSVSDAVALESSLQAILQSDYKGNLHVMLADYQRVLADNHQREQWPRVHEKLQTLFMCGKAVPLDGPMIGIPVSIRDSDLFRDTANLFSQDRSLLASIELMATAWNATFADTGLWMGKTFEPVSKVVIQDKCDGDPELVAAYDPAITRIGRNFFREPGDPNLLQNMGLPVLEQVWRLQDRPTSISAKGFDGELQAAHLEKEQAIPYSMTGGVYLADMGRSATPEMNGKAVYQLNYRWPKLNPSFPMSCLVDELVQVGEGIYLGQLVFATKRFSLGAIDLPFIPGKRDIELGEPYEPNKHSIFDWIRNIFSGRSKDEAPDYGYQNNGYFLMMDPAYAKQVYADDAFPQLRPRPGEMGYEMLGYGEAPTAAKSEARDWVKGWREDEALKEKFTTLITEPSPQASDGDVTEMRGDDESVLQMLQRISHDISAQTKHEDHLKHFEQLNRLFRSGVAPKVNSGLFQGGGKKGYNVRIDGREVRDWYGGEESTEGFDYYHGATLNLHWGFSETFCPDRDNLPQDASLIPTVLANALNGEVPPDARFLVRVWRALCDQIFSLFGKSADQITPAPAPNVMNIVWHNIGKYIFPWAGKSFERISPRKLSMLLDEGGRLSERYPQRVAELKRHLASAPHYALVKKNQQNYWACDGRFAEHLASGSWDAGMSHEDKNFWTQEAAERWVMGYNLQDQRVVVADALMQMVDMNYRVPEPVLQQVSEASGSPFLRQGYAFLGVADQTSILPMNSGAGVSKKVFQFHYRFPMIGGAIPIGFCLDELVEIADGLFLGQLIYSTALNVPFHSSVDPSEYKYQLFGYFLLLDDEWEHHRQAIKLDTLHDKPSLLN